ncbi:cullin 4 [Fistulifera solaris]|uniref:Cullin 4 n=1 Tax=Fistulifera solaris TaxID=1519565 RepID=A0A1Z5JJB0_FISSO|nr:cullin 4 [Fistulifera solaris]|eukprot:GAX14074.1 cullin 4 [Fistulifera solaris]
MSRNLMHQHAAATSRNKAKTSKIVIRPFSKPPSLPANYYEQTVKELLDGTLEILNRQLAEYRGEKTEKQTDLSLQNAYTSVVTLVRHQYGPRLYEDWIQSMKQAVRIVLPHTGLGQGPLLQIIPELYRIYTEYLLCCQHVLLPLDRTHGWNGTTAVPVSAHAQTLWTAGLAAFAEQLQFYLKTIYQEWFQVWIYQDWKIATSTPVLQSIWYMWQDLQVLSSLPIEADLHEYWERTSKEVWESFSSNSQGAAAQFITWTHQQFSVIPIWPWLPVQWLGHVLDTCITQPLILDGLLAQERFWQPFLQQELVTSATSVPLTQLWLLCGRLPSGHAKVAQVIASFVKQEGLRRSQSVADLLALQSMVKQTIARLPGAGEVISLKSVWEEVVNSEESLAEPLAKHLDQILKSAKKLDVQPADWLSSVVTGIFVPLQAKDIFEAFYKRDLAKRLLWNKVVSMDIEKQVCSFLKAECGAGYTSKMEGMFQDIDLSREHMLVYKQAAEQNASQDNRVEMEVQILTTGYWPVYPQYQNLQLPSSLLERQNSFDAFYKKKCHGRRVAWQYALGNCLVKTNGFSKPYELNVSLLQALVLIQFTDAETKWTLPGLMQAIGLEDRDEMERILQSLALGKEGTRILRKLDPDGKKKPRMTVQDEDEFLIQTAFVSNQRRIRIQNIMMKETKEERDKTVETVSRDRLYLIDAVLVRILKARKTVLHQQLIPQVMEQVKFPAQAADVKSRIESLIEREYMERDAKDRNRYNYLA